MGRIPVAPPSVGIGEPVLLGSVSYDYFDYVTPETGYVREVSLPLSRPMGEFRIVYIQGIGLRACAGTRYQPMEVRDRNNNMLTMVNVGIKTDPRDALTVLFIAPGGEQGYFSCKDSSRGDIWYPKGDFFDTGLRLYDGSGYLGSGTVKVWGIL